MEGDFLRTGGRKKPAKRQKQEFYKTPDSGKVSFISEDGFADS